MEWGLTDDRPARFGAWLPGAMHCDPLALGLGPSEAAMVDPQQRMLMELTQEVRECASVGAGRCGEG